MQLKKILTLLILFFLILDLNNLQGQVNPVVDKDLKNKELLLRMPLLSDKTAGIVENALRSMNGIQSVEACYEVGTMIVSYRPDIITDENTIVEKIRQLEINTSVEPLTTRDIPLIREKYNVIRLSSAIHK